MTVLWSLLVAAGISLHIFVGMMETGATQSETKKQQILLLAAVFAAIQLSVQISGVFLTWFIKNFLQIKFLEQILKLTCILLLLGIGIQLMAKIRSWQAPEEKHSPMTLKQCAFLSFKTSTVAFAMGIILYYYVSLAAGIFLVFLAVLSAIAGFTFGYFNGVKNEKLLCGINSLLVLILVSQFIFR